MPEDLLKWHAFNDDGYRQAPFWDLNRLAQYFQNFDVINKTIQIESIGILPQITGSALIIDKSMASTKFFEQLPALKNYKGTVFCCDRALYAIIPYRVPEYVVNVDVSSLCFSFFDRLDVKKIMGQTSAVFPVTANPLTVRLWHGKRYFFTPSLGYSISKSLAAESSTLIMHTGGQVASTAYVLAYNLGAETIGLFGITHSYDSLDETEYPLQKRYHQRVKGPYGLQWQDPTYDFYNKEYLELIEGAKKHGITTVNASKAGLLYSADIEDMSLEEFVSKTTA